MSPPRAQASEEQAEHEAMVQSQEDWGEKGDTEYAFLQVTTPPPFVLIETVASFTQY